jgi:FdhD protein
MQREYHSSKIARVTDATQAIDVVRVRGGARTPASDRAAAEEPLEIRLRGQPFATIMRTPGADLELAAGFLLAERIIKGADDLATIECCSDSGNVVDVSVVDEDVLGRATARRVTATASCGVCGRATIDSLTADLSPIAGAFTMPPAIVAALPARLRAAQPAFDESGGLHAAGLFAPGGDLVDVAEDVGRHNAVDKVIGRRLFRDELPLSAHALCVSGRTSFEIVQKAAVAGIPLVAAVSAPSTLAIDLAARAGITLVGFVRGDSFNIYAHGHRIA